MATATPDFLRWTWADIEPQYTELLRREITSESIGTLLDDWSKLEDRVGELGARIKLATDQNTADEEASARYREFAEEIAPRLEEADHRLTQRFLAAGIVPAGMEVPVRAMRVDTELFREENLPLKTQEALLVEEYFKIVGSQTVEWDGTEIPIAQLAPVMEEQDRERRERAWRLGAERRLQDRAAISDVWRKLVDLRRQIAANAGYVDYRAYRWRELKRFDYTPEDTLELHRTIERTVVPILSRMHERRRQRLGIESVRPWDREVDVLGRPPLQPYEKTEELEGRIASIINRVDPALGDYFETMRREQLLDLENRMNKSPGAYCTTFPASDRPFIFANSTRTQNDITVLVHEGGHAFHSFEMNPLPWAHQKMASIPIEFAEVASMSMELLTARYWTVDEGGFYSQEDADRAVVAHLEQILTLLPWIAAIDAFQFWIYEHPEEAVDADAADREWARLIGRFMPSIDWAGLEDQLGNDWRRIPHLFGWPLYFIEYALAQLGAIQVWANARRDQTEAVRQYREALSLGGTATLPELYAAAGARFAFDEATIREAMALVESTLEEHGG